MAKDWTKHDKSPLVKLLLQNEIPPDFLRSIVDEASKNPSYFNTIFSGVVNGLNINMQSNAVVDGKLCVTPIIALNELLNVTLIDESNVRPICNMIAKMKNFYPTLTTEFTGREITKTSFLGPFLALSVFSEDNFRILDDESKQDIEHVSDNLRSVSLSSFIKKWYCTPLMPAITNNCFFLLQIFTATGGHAHATAFSFP